MMKRKASQQKDSERGAPVPVSPAWDTTLAALMLRPEHEGLKALSPDWEDWQPPISCNQAAPTRSTASMPCGHSLFLPFLPHVWCYAYAPYHLQYVISVGQCLSSMAGSGEEGQDWHNVAAHRHGGGDGCRQSPQDVCVLFSLRQ
jgi:hypothetical protein